MQLKIRKKVSIVIAVMVISVLLTSCFGIAMETVFNADGSGRLVMKLRFAQMLLDMDEGEAGVDVPMSKEDLEEQYGELEGVTVVEVTEEDTEEDRIITAVIEFEDFNSLASDDEFPGEEARLETVDGKSVLKILVGQPGEEPSGDGGEEAAEDAEMAEMQESMTAMIQSFMEGYSLEYRVVAPSKIISYSDGEVEKDGRTFVYTMPMGDFIAIEEPFYLEIVW
jgi:hypothetical protein